MAALLLAGCASRTKTVAAPAAEPDYDWKNFKGGDTASAAAAESKSDKADKADKIDKTEKASVDDASSKKVSTKKIGGHSVSDVSADDLASTSKSVTKRNVVSMNTIVGAEYEQINVVLEKMTIQIIRPAASPDKTGPKVRSPKTRSDDAADTDATLYDANADVLVLVQADKKAISKKALAALVGGATAKKKAGAVRSPKQKRTG